MYLQPTIKGVSKCRSVSVKQNLKIEIVRENSLNFFYYFRDLSTLKGRLQSMLNAAARLIFAAVVTAPG